MNYATAPDGVRLAYADEGAGPAVLCLPGLSRNMDDFLPFLHGFRDRARIIRMDFRGRGGSDWAPPETYSIPHEAGDVVALLDHLGLERAAILGTSRGGLVAMLLAATVKARLSGVCLNDVGPVISPEGLDNIMGYLGRAPGYKTYAEAEAAMPAAHPGFHDVPVANWAAHVRALWREGPDGLELRYDAKLRDAIAPAFDTTKPAPDIWPWFDALSGLPLALIRGAASNILSAETASQMRQRRPDMGFAELSDRGHVPFLDEPAAMAVLDTWIEALP
ncbi:MAG: alpha/beta hydrolase [Pseudomonadota bacterium]